jgi:hypothetical protein
MAYNTAKAISLCVVVSLVYGDDDLKLTEMEEQCKTIENARKQLEQQLTGLEKLESEAKEKSKETQMLREIARIRGEEPPPEPNLEALEKTKKDIETLESEIKKQEREVYKGMKDISLPIPKEIPKVSPEGNSAISFEGGSYDYAVKFIAETMKAEVPIEIDKTQLHSDKIIVSNIKDPSDVIERLKTLRNNIGRLAKIALQEQDPDVETVVEYLSKSDYKALWEALKGRKRISYEGVYSELGISDEKDRKRVRNFFTNLEKQLNDKFPFIRIDSGTYELSFFGSLVWKRYNDKYTVQSASEKVTNNVVIKRENSKEEAKKASMPSLNKYLSDEDKELIYGKEGN